MSDLKLDGVTTAKELVLRFVGWAELMAELHPEHSALDWLVMLQNELMRKRDHAD